MPSELPAAEHLERALDAYASGQYVEAAADLETVAEGLGPGIDRSRALRLASVARRRAGDPANAAGLAMVAVAEAPPGTAVLTEALADLSTALLLSGRVADAAQAAAQARDSDPGHDPALTAQVLAKSAYAAAAAGLAEEAGAAVDALSAHLTQTPVDPRFATVGGEDLAAVLDAVLTSQLDSAPAAAGPLLAAAVAVRGGDSTAAAVALADTRRSARESFDLPSYIGAALLQAQLAEAEDDRATAYEHIAVGWASVREAAGDEVARVAFAHVMQDFVDRWGPRTYTAIRDAYGRSRQQYQ